MTSCDTERRRGSARTAKWENNLEDGAPPWVYDTKSLVLANGADSTAVLVPADTVYQVRVCFAQLVNELSRAHVPHTNHIITAWREGGMKRRIVVLVRTENKKRTVVQNKDKDVKSKSKTECT